MRFKTGLLALVIGLAPLSIAAAQVMTRQDPRDRRPTSTGGTIGDIIFGDARVETPRQCRVRDAVTPDGRVVQICDDRRRGRDDDPAFEHRRDGRGRRAHVNDRDGDGDFDAHDRALRKAEKDRAKALRKARS